MSAIISTEIAYAIDMQYEGIALMFDIRNEKKFFCCRNSGKRRVIELDNCSLRLMFRFIFFKDPRFKEFPSICNAICYNRICENSHHLTIEDDDVLRSFITQLVNYQFHKPL